MSRCCIDVVNRNDTISAIFSEKGRNGGLSPEQRRTILRIFMSVLLRVRKDIVRCGPVIPLVGEDNTDGEREMVIMQINVAPFGKVFR